MRLPELVVQSLTQAALARQETQLEALYRTLAVPVKALLLAVRQALLAASEALPGLVVRLLCQVVPAAQHLEMVAR